MKTKKTLSLVPCALSLLITYAATRSERLPDAGRQSTPPFGFAQGHEPVEWQMVTLRRQGWCFDGGSGLLVSFDVFYALR
jgi:hypothetical protein